MASNPPALRIQSLFLIVLGAKVASSGAAWALGRPWSLGFALPVALMCLYIVLGLRRAPDDVGDERFADSCYYLGFIFTITSIVFALFDLPAIGTRIEDIAVRFGAAMVSTVLGLCVRVWLVTFRRDAADATEEAADAVMDASLRLREQLAIALERLRDFESDVDAAARATVARVGINADALAQANAARLDAWLAELGERQQQAFAEQLAQVGVATARLAEFVDAYAGQMRTHMNALQQFTSATTDKVLERLRTAEFPEDYFARHMAVPMRQLRNASEEISENVRQAATAVSRSSLMLLTSMKKMRERAVELDASVGGGQRLMELAQEQLDVLRRLSDTLAALERSLQET